MGKYVLGIDLGTTKSVAALFENGKPHVIENTMGKRITPSFAALKTDKKTGETSWLVGDSAKNQVMMNPLKTLYGVKRLIGRRFDDPEVAKMQGLASYKIVKAPNGDAWVEIDGKQMAPAEVSAKVLGELKAAAEKYLGTDENGNQIEVTEAVITCPAYFNDAQIKATKDAGAIAGLNVLRVIKEPTAAALAYGMDKQRNGKVIVYDLGGGTFDVSVLELDMEKDGGLLTVLSNSGDTFLGGENFDERIMEHLIAELKTQGVDISEKNAANATVLQRLKDQAEKAKIELSTQQSVDINIPFIGKDEDGGDVNFEYTLTRSKLESLVADLIEKTRKPCEEALKAAGLTINDIDEVLLVGAQTRMPKVIDTVRNIFKKEPRMDLPAQEIVALGAAVQGAILQGKVDNVVLVDVIPLSIGLRAAGNVFSKIVEANSSIPCKVSSVFSTARDNQRNVEINLYQGERAQATDNKLLGTFTLDGILPAKAGEPQIEVTLDIDANGILNVSAKDLKTGRAAKITVQANGGLTEAEIERMKKDAAENAAKDEAFKKALLATTEAENEAKEIAIDVEQDYYKQAPVDLKQLFDETVKELTEAKAAKNADVVLEKVAKVRELRSQLGEAFGAAQGGGDATPPAADTTATPEGPTPPSM